MIIKFDENGYITNFSYADNGLSDGIIVDNSLEPENFQDNCKYYKFVNNEFVYDADKKQSVLDRETLKGELKTLERWFDEYDIQCNQYRRCLDLGIEYDKDIMALHQQAETNKTRINEILNLLSS